MIGRVFAGTIPATDTTAPAHPASHRERDPGISGSRKNGPGRCPVGPREFRVECEPNPAPHQGALHFRSRTLPAQPACRGPQIRPIEGSWLRMGDFPMTKPAMGTHSSPYLCNWPIPRARVRRHQREIIASTNGRASALGTALSMQPMKLNRSHSFAGAVTKGPPLWPPCTGPVRPHRRLCSAWP